MLNIIQNTIGAIRRVGESVVRAGLKMWLPFTKAEPLGRELITNGDFSENFTLSTSSYTYGWVRASVSDAGGSIVDNKLSIYYDGSNTDYSRVYATDGVSSINVKPVDHIGKLYELKYDVISKTGTVNLKFYNGGNVDIPSNIGTNTYRFLSQSNRLLIFKHESLGQTIVLDNITLRELTQETPDISGNDNNAILKTGKALQFTGNDSVQTSFPSSYTIKTIAFWIKPTHSSTDETIFYGGGGVYTTRQLYLNHLALESETQHIAMNTYVNGSLEGVTFYGTPATLTQDEWQRVVLTSSTGFSVVSDTFDIGSGLYGSDGRFIMSDLQIYDEAWTTDDIAYDYANPQKLVTDSEDTSITLDNLKAWWHLSEGDGTVAFDSAPLLGKELVVNGDFSTDSDWYTPTGWSIANGKATKTGVSSNGLRQAINLPIAKVFQLTFEVSGKTGGYLKGEIFGGGGSDEFFNYEIENGSHSFTTTSTVNRTHFHFYAYGGFDGSIDNVSIKEVFNIDGETYDGSSLGASYVDAQERIPQLGMMNWSKGSNLLEYSEDFTEWTVGANATLTYESDVVAPDGTVGVYRLLLPAQGSTFLQSPSYAAASGRVFSCWVKKTDNNNTDFNFYDGTTASSTLTATNDWQRFEVNSFTGNQAVIINDGDTFISDIYIWGAQVESGTTASAYRRTNGSAVTDATLISCATDSQKDILGNAVRIKGSGFNLDGTGYGEVLDDNIFDIPASSTQNGGAFSICGWAKWKYVEQAGSSSLNTIYSNGLNATNVNNFSVNSRLLNGNNVISAWVSGTGKNSSTTYTQGEWVYFALTRQITTGSCKLYTSRIDSNGQWVVALDGTTTNTNSLVNSGNKTIGWDGTINDRRYHERIDDIKFYDRELSLDEIEQNFNATKSGHNN